MQQLVEETRLHIKAARGRSSSNEEARSKAKEEYDKVIKRDTQVKLWSRSGVDERHAQRQFCDMAKHKEWNNAMNQSMTVVRRGGVLCLLGDRGNGKTQCGVELIRQTCLESKSCLYIRVREVGIKLRQAYDSSNSIDEAMALNTFVKPHLLVIDECQEKPDKEWEFRHLTLILDKRYGAMRPTVLIANSTVPQFKELMGGSIVDRIYEGGGAILFDWPSFREK